MEHRPRSVLVTGGAGFIGANFVHHLVETDPAVRVVILDALTYAGSLENLRGLPEARHRFVRGDVCDAALVGALLREERVDTIVHFAAESHVDRSIAGAAEFVRTNVVGTYVLLEQARQAWRDATGAVRFHHVSTDEVYGTLAPDEPPFRDTTPYAPRSPYSASKAGADHLVRAWHHTYGLPATISNCSNNFGRFQHPEKFLPTVIRGAAKGEPIPVYGDGRQVRDWLDVRDHCEAIDRIVRRSAPGRTWLVGAGNERANLDVARLVCRIVDELRPVGAPRERLVTFVADRPGHDRRYALDATPLREELAWAPRHAFEDALRETVRWYLETRRYEPPAG